MLYLRSTVGTDTYKNSTLKAPRNLGGVLQLGLHNTVIGHGIGGKYIPIMARLAKARRWSKR